MDSILHKRLEMYSALMDEAANLIEQIPPAVFATLPGHRYPLCDELGGAAGMARDDMATLRATTLQSPSAATPGQVEGSNALFDAREQAAMLAALRYWQREGVRSEGHEQDIATDSGTLEPLSESEIDGLCERVNMLESRADLANTDLASGDFMKDHMRAVAESFCKKLARDLGDPKVYALVCLQNLVETDPRICHSHDYLDANMTMTEAVGEALGIAADEVDVHNTRVMDLWNGAWEASTEDMHLAARIKLGELFDRLSVMHSVHAKAPSLGLSGREAVLAAGNEIYGEKFVDAQEAISFVTGLSAAMDDSSESRYVLKAVEGALASKADGGDTAARNLRTVVVAALKGDSSGTKHPIAMVMVDAYLAKQSQGGDELFANLRKLLRETIVKAAIPTRSGFNPLPGGHSAYEATEEDVANVLSSNAMAVANTNGKSFESMAAEFFPLLDFARIEDAALQGDELDQQTDYANDEITRQLRVMGVLEPLKAVEAVHEEGGRAPGGLKKAIEALRLAAECGGDLDKPFYQEALAGLLRVNSQVLAYDASLNAREEAPTGSDFNEVFEMLGLDPKSLLDPSAEQWGSLRSSLQTVSKAKGVTAAEVGGAAEQLAILQTAMEHISQGGVQYSTDARELTAMAKEALKDAGLAPVRLVAGSRDDGPSL